MKTFRKREYESANPGVGVGFAQPGKACWSSCGDLFAPAYGDEEVVGQLPDCVGACGPDHHGAEGVVLGTVIGAKFYVVDCGEAGSQD